MKKKVIRLNEQDIENLVKKIIKEDFNNPSSTEKYSEEYYLELIEQTQYNLMKLTHMGITPNDTVNDHIDGLLFKSSEILDEVVGLIQNPDTEVNQDHVGGDTSEEKYKEAMDAYLGGFHDRRPNKSDYGLE